MDNAVIAPGTAALDLLRAREPFAAILVYDDSARAVALDTALAGLTRLGAHVVRIANPLRTPLTMERVLIQLAGFQTDLRLGEDTDALMRTVIDKLQAGHNRLIVSVEQAETLHPMALILLDQIARPPEPGGRSPQVLLTGTPAFARVLGHPLLGRMRDVLRIGTPDVMPSDTEPLGAPAVTPAPHLVPMPVDRWSTPDAADALNPASSVLAPPNIAPSGIAPPGIVTPGIATAHAVAGPESSPSPSTPVAAADAARPRPITAHEVRRVPSQSRGRLWPALLIMGVPAIIAGGLYAAWQAHLIPPEMEAAVIPWIDEIRTWFGTTIVPWIDRAVSWVTSTIAAAMTRLLPGAGLF